MKIVSVVGARPQFIKAAVVSQAVRAAGTREVSLHTGQHYDERMSRAFFRELDIAPPDYQLSIGSGTHGDQTGRMLTRIEGVIATESPDRVLVYGDTNSTLAGALAAAKLRVPVDHVEAGLRSFDRDMPEELNRILTDQLADQLFCPTPGALDRLRSEGLAQGASLVGDVMLDLVLLMRPAIERAALPDGLHDGAYFVATVHRPSNTDDPERLAAVVQTLRQVADEHAPVVLPCHPRLAAAFERSGVSLGRLRIMPPAGYVEMQALIGRARGVITDSGGVQKEALFHGVPCITLRDSTEWLESVEAGMNTLVGGQLDRVSEIAAICDGRRVVAPTVLESFGGGCAGQRIAQAVASAGSTRRRWRARA